MMRAALIGEVCERATGAASLADYERGVLGLLRGVVRFEVGFFVRGGRLGAAHHGLDPNVVARCQPKWQRFGQELAPVFAAASRHGLAIDVNVLGPHFTTTSVYRDFVLPHDGSSTVLAPLRLRGRHLATLALGRGGADFQCNQLQALAELLPALCLGELAFADMADQTAQTPRMNPSEQDVLDYLRLGYTNGEIARARGSSVNTVRNQLQSLYRKLGATTRAEAVAISLGHVRTQ